MEATHAFYIASTALLLFMCVFGSFRKLIFRTAGGIMLLAAAKILGISAGINAMSVLCCSLLGIPGALTFLAVFQIIK